MVSIKGTMLVVIAQDGNDNIFILAFALVKGEIGSDWSFI